MKQPKNNPFTLIINCMLLLLLSQTVAAVVVVLLYSGNLYGAGMTVEEADALMLEIMYAHETEILLISYVVVLLVIWIMAKRRKLNTFTFSGLHRPAKPALIILATIAGFAAAFWATIAVNMIPWPEAMLEAYQTETSALTTAKPVLDFIALVLVGPLVEELLFRGIIYDALCVFLPAGIAVPFQGMLFGSVHSTLIWMIYAMFMGCLLGYVRKRTGSLRPCVLMHMAFNGSSYLFSWFAERYGEDPATIMLLFIASALVLLLTMYGISFRTDIKDETKN